MIFWVLWVLAIITIAFIGHINKYKDITSKEIDSMLKRENYYKRNKGKF